MKINHHPPEASLAAFSAGTLDHGQHVAVATHLVGCSRCRESVRAFERFAGVILDDTAPVAMASDALAKVEARFDEAPVVREKATVSVPASELPGLPEFLRSYRFDDWKRIARSTYVRPIQLPHASDTRVFLLKGAPGTKLLRHSHSGVEMTCILTGGYSQYGQHFGPGDFDFGDDAIEHDPVVDTGEDCICLVAMEGGLRLHGMLGRILQPFIRL